MNEKLIFSTFIMKQITQFTLLKMANFGAKIQIYERFKKQRKFWCENFGAFFLSRFACKLYVLRIKTCCVTFQRIECK